MLYPLVAEYDHHFVMSPARRAFPVTVPRVLNNSAGESGYARRGDESGDPTATGPNANAQALATQVKRRTKTTDDYKRNRAYGRR